MGKGVGRAGLGTLPICREVRGVWTERDLDEEEKQR